MSFSETVSEDDQLKLPMFTSCAAGTREQRSDKSIYAAPAKGKKQFHERASRGMQHESAAQACTHIRSVPAESGAKVIRVFPRKHARGIVCEGHISRLVKSFKSTTVHLPGQSRRSYISRSSDIQNRRVKALPRGCGSSFSYVQNRPWKVMATLKVPQVNLCRERKSHGRESSEKVS